MSKSKSRQFEKLVRLMERLRAKNGCPWDRAQTHSSMKKHLIEEAYEVCEAIDSGDPEKLKDELGDFLFQVIFHAQIAKERGAFDIDDILDTSYKKMIRRHPHVFGKHKASSPDEAYKRWQEKKDLESAHKGKNSLLKGIPDKLPALLKAEKVSRRAAGLGFNIEEELRRIEKTAKGRSRTFKYSKLNNKKARNKEEIGDMLFAIVNLAISRGVVAEEALNNSTKKFTARLKKSVWR